MAQKYIINSGSIRMGHVQNHNELARDHATTKGGGYWHIDHEKKQVYLFGVSTQFGAASKEQVQDALLNGYVSQSLAGYEWWYSMFSLNVGEAIRDAERIKVPDVMDTQEFYEVMQQYRLSPQENQDEVVMKFEAVKNWIRENYKKEKVTAEVSENFTMANAIEAINARMNGIWDNEQLVKMGTLSDCNSDIERIISMYHKSNI